MVNRLTPREAMVYFLDDKNSTTHLGALMIITPEELEVAARTTSKTAPAPTHAALDYRRLVHVVENRLQLVPRYRQIVKEVTLGLARPVWADDPDFDITFHIRRSGLPAPGGFEHLRDLISRIMSRPLDKTRPLWEMYLIEGLADGKLAVLTKSHRCLVDDADNIEISEVICDDSRDTDPLPEEIWMPGYPPSSTSLALGAIAEAVSRPGEMISSVVSNGVIGEARSTAGGAVRRASTLVRQLADSAPASPLNKSTTSTRSFTVATVPRRGCAKVADRYGCTVNDVVLAIISGVLRRWKLSVAESISPDDTVRVVLPLSARDPSMHRRLDAEGRWIAVGRPGFVTDLPIGEDNPSMRILQVAGLATRHAQSSRRVSTGLGPMLPEIGMIPFPELSSRAFRTWNFRGFNVPISIGSGPISRRYLAGHKVSELYTVPALLAGRALAISVIEYGTTLSFAFIGDRGVIADLPEMSGFVTESFEDLLTAK